MPAANHYDPDVVFLFDVDNTLLDNDRILAEAHAHFSEVLGTATAARYWEICEELRQSKGFVDYLSALQIFRVEHLDDPRILQLAFFLLDYPFQQCLFPNALAVLQHCRQWGETAILSDGDAVFQPRKIRHADLAAAVEERILIYVHKELMLDDMQRRFPARHYVMVDDKLGILTAMKKVLGERLTTVFVRQGHYALAIKNTTAHPQADISIERIGDLLNYDRAALLLITPPG